MTTLLLIRHAQFDHLGARLVGRAGGVHLNAAGRSQAAELAAALARVTVELVCSSPMERAVETAETLAGPRGLTVHVEPGLMEVDFGSWTGVELERLAGDAAWDAFNCDRAGTRIPGGETMLEVQARAVAALERLAAERPDATIAAVSHADVLRAAICGWLGLPIDGMLRFELAPASVSVVVLGGWKPSLRLLNWRGDLRELP